jgi:hypothetical protein
VVELFGESGPAGKMGSPSVGLLPDGEVVE